MKTKMKKDVVYKVGGKIGYNNDVTLDQVEFVILEENSKKIALKGEGEEDLVVIQVEKSEYLDCLGEVKKDTFTSGFRESFSLYWKGNDGGINARKVMVAHLKKLIQGEIEKHMKSLQDVHDIEDRIQDEENSLNK